MTSVTARFKNGRKVYEMPLDVDFISGAVVSSGPLAQMKFDHSTSRPVIAEGENKLAESDSGDSCKNCGNKKPCKPCLAKKAKREKAKQKRRSISSTVKGAIGLAKSEMGIGAVSNATLGHRRSICISCDRQELGVCNECGCYCAAKVKLTKERCPIGKWESGEADDGNN